MKKRAMIDLETLGTKPGCVILEIGIVVSGGLPATGKTYTGRAGSQEESQ